MSAFPLLDTGQYMFFITLALVFLIFYFLLIRPQRKEQKEREALIANVKKGDKIITIGGIHGMVSLTKEKTVVVKVDEGCKIEISRSAIATVIQEQKEDSKAKSKNEIEDEIKKEENPELKKGVFPFFRKKKNDKKSK